MKKILLATLFVGAFGLTGCDDYLNILPNDKQTTEMYWKSSADVEAILAEGYSSMRTCIPYMIDWGELRGASVVTSITNAAMIGDFKVLPDNTRVSWQTFYKVIGMANSVLEFAPGVMAVDESYREQQMNSHLTEAYFMRGLMYLYLVRNFREVPLVKKAYVTDEVSNDIAKSSEAEILDFILSDVEAALATNAAKEQFESSWANKGRATKWALYALGAETCLWAEDYEGCVKYADMLINASSGLRPVFITASARWFENFYTQEGNGSNESVFELIFDASNTSNSATNSYTPTKQIAFTTSSVPSYFFSEAMTQRLSDEGAAGSVRAKWGAAAGDESSSSETGLVTSTYYPSNALVWKYTGMGVENTEAARAGTGNDADANWIIYRMADVMLMKAEALVRLGGTENWTQALAIINQIRQRAGLTDLTDITTETIAETDELSLLKAVLNERDMEFAAEGKRWYDLLRLGKQQNFKYRSEFVSLLQENNGVMTKWLSSVLSDDNAWYLPIPEADIKTNKLLIQNPYYDTSKKQ